MSKSYFEEKYKVEEEARLQIEKKLKRLFDLRALKYIGNEEDGITFDKDYVGYTVEGRRITFEVKVRLPPKGRERGYSDIAVETVSNDSTGTPGWIYTSKADWLIYVFTKGGKITRFYAINLPAFRSWFLENEHKYSSLKAPNPTYNTVFKPIPIKDIPPQLFKEELLQKG